LASKKIAFELVQFTLPGPTTMVPGDILKITQLSHGDPCLWLVLLRLTIRNEVIVINASPKDGILLGRSP
jgi:hypothetical protein